MTTRQRVVVTLAAQQFPGGTLLIKWSDTGLVTVLDAGDYIVPADVRLDAMADRIYLRAEGGPWTGGPDVTVLSEYDLPTRKLLQKRQVEKSARLPDLCPATPHR